jgi:hypothetical protein
MDVTLLYFDECPSWQIAAGHLEVLSRANPEIKVTRVIVDTPEAAVKQSFRGSPSIHVKGQDLFADRDEPVGLACRIYQTPDGPAGSPTLEQLRDALQESSTDG